MTNNILPVLSIEKLFLFPKCEIFLSKKEISLPLVKEALLCSFTDYNGLLLVVPKFPSKRKNQVLSEEFFFQYGTLAKIDFKQHSSTDFSEVLENIKGIKLVGLENRVELKKVHVKNGFLVLASYDDLQEKQYTQEEVEKIEEKFIRVLPNIFEKANLQIDDPLLLTSHKDTKELLDFIVQKSNNFDESFKREMLSLDALDKRLNLLINHTTNKESDHKGNKKEIFHKEKIDKKIEEETKKAIDKQNTEYYLRQKIATIKEELAKLSRGKKNSDYASDYSKSIDEEGWWEKILKQLEENPYPEYVKKVIKEELSRYDSVSTASGESNIIRQYIDYLLSLPWWQKSEEINDLAFAREKLNSKHYGLYEIKERIIEYLAVKQKTNNSLGQVICFVGPPGVGKSSLASSIAEATGRKFARIPLAGMKDPAEIKGHRRTYVGAMPGRIIATMKKTDANPLILLDEIDKIFSDYRGDPTDALLEVLDPKQNKEFIDDYLGNDVPYDLSQVMFICTANSIWNLPTPLLDRMEVIKLYSYTEIEKLNIAKEHLIPENLEKYHLGVEEIKFTDEAIKDIIKYHTRETGVRELNRKIQTIIRKFILQELENKEKASLIDSEVLKKYFKKRDYEFTAKQGESNIGVATGLAWTEVGGDILLIEVNCTPGKGDLILTGNLGDIMKESAQVALAYVKARKEFFQIPANFFQKNDIHIHALEGAVPKEGPSAGITLVTAIISALTENPIPADYGMTGEITLHGKVQAIGGLKEKAIAAHRSGLKTIIVPKENEKDLLDIPKEVLEDLKIVLVKDYQEVWKEIFTQKTKEK